MTEARSAAPLPHVTQVLLCLGRGGLESLAVQLAVGLKRRGYGSSVIALDEGGELEATLANANVPYHIFGRRSFRTVRYHRDMFRLLRRIAPDVLHTHNVSPLIRALPAAKLAGVQRMVHTEHGTGYMDERPSVHRMVRVASLFVDEFVLVGNRLIPYYRDRIGVRTHHLRVVFNGVDVERFQPMSDVPSARARAGLPPGLLIGSAGRFTWEKNFGLLLRGVAAARESGVDVKLVLLGDGAQRAELESLVDTLGIRSAVSFIGWRADTETLLPLLDLYVVSSATEGLPLAVLEAMACGIPVASTSVGELPALLGDGTCGTLYPAGDVNALATIIADANANPARRARQGAMARALVIREYSIGRMLERYIASYHRGSPGKALLAPPAIGPHAVEG